MQSAKDLMVIDENGTEHVPIDLADIDSALAGVRSQAPIGMTANQCYELWRQWVNGKSAYEIERDEKTKGTNIGIKRIVGAIQFIRYKVGLSIDPQVEQHKLVAYTKLVIGGLTEQLHECARKILFMNKLMRGFESSVPDNEEDLLELFNSLNTTDIGKYAALLDIRSKEIRTMTSITSQIAVYNEKLSVLTGANIAAKKTANKQKAKTLADRIDHYDDATLENIIKGFSTDVEEEFKPAE